MYRTYRGRIAMAARVPLVVLLLSDPSKAMMLAQTGKFVQVFDGTFAPNTLKTVLQAGEDRGHCFTSIFDRGPDQENSGRTIIESALTSVLEQLEDDSRYVEYWWRGESKGMEIHRDVDEALCRSHHIGGVGVQRCPTNGHVLYLDVGPEVRGPTCIWEEEPPSEDPAKALAIGADPRAGAPRSLRALHIVPAVAGRLLRFDGASLHSVEGPKCSLLAPDSSPTTAPPAAAGVRRCVLLFNTWSTPPQLPSPKDPAAPGAVAALKALEMRPECEPFSRWRRAPTPDAPTSSARAEGDHCAPALVEGVLLGDATRRGCSSTTLDVEVCSSSALRAAVNSRLCVYSLELTPVPAPRAVRAATPVPDDDSAVAVDSAEELAMRLGHAEHLESEFWGIDVDDEWEDDEWEDDGSHSQDDDHEQGEGVAGMEGQADFWANVAALQELQQNGAEGTPNGGQNKAQG